MYSTSVRRAAWPTMALLGGALLAQPALADDGDKDDDRPRGERVYAVHITNLTKGQVFSPPVLATHSSRVRVFEAGEPASEELVMVAEDGAAGPLADALDASPNVADVVVGEGPVPPGATAGFEISSTSRFRLFSAVGMLVNTNDAFFGANSLPLPRYRGGSQSTAVIGYDAGSERNNELCAFVPGPACPGDSGNARDTDDAEGHVHVHNGVHGVFDGAPSELDPNAYDWRNPVARIVITRIR